MLVDTSTSSSANNTLTNITAGFDNAVSFSFLLEGVRRKIVITGCNNNFYLSDSYFGIANVAWHKLARLIYTNTLTCKSWCLNF